MITKLVVENLKHRPVRTLLSVLAVAVEVTMILTLVGVSRGSLEEAARRAKGIGADIWIKPPGTSLLSFSSAPMPEGIVGLFQKQPHITLAVGDLVQSLGGLESVHGVDLEKFSQMNGGFTFIAGTKFEKPGDIIVDERYASQNKVSVGSKVRVLNLEWRICGIIQSGMLARVVLPIEVLQGLISATGKVSQVFLKVDDPAKTKEIIDGFKANPDLKEFGIYPMEELLSQWDPNNIPMLKGFTAVVVFVSVVVGFLVVFLSMYTAVLERTREIGILKSLGASRGYILGLLVRETALLAVAGSLAGIGLTYGTQWLMTTFGPISLIQKIVTDWWLIAIAISLAGALLGTLYPAWKAATQDALEALSYE